MALKVRSLLKRLARVVHWQLTQLLAAVLSTRPDPLALRRRPQQSLLTTRSRRRWLPRP